MIIVRLQGGMGNQMFQYALGRALAIQNNVPLGLDLAFLLDRTPHPVHEKFVFRNYDLHVFNIEAEIVPQSKIPYAYRLYTNKIIVFIKNHFFNKMPGSEKHFHFDQEIALCGPRAYLDGYWQSPTYFKDIEPIIRKDFTLKKQLSEKAQVLLSEISSKNSVCINVRRGDFVDNAYHEVVGKEYYDRGIEYLKKIQDLDKIYVFSDDIEWCEHNLTFQIQTQFVGREYAGDTYEEYLYLMAACKYFIIPNSSFAWWGAWLSVRENKKIITPLQWFGDATINSNDLIPEEWIRI